MNSPTFYKDHLVTSEEFTLNITQPHGYLATHPTPDTSQLSKYYNHPDYHSHNEDLHDITSRLFHLTKIINTRYKKRVVQNYISSNDSILDYGCGTGYFLHSIRNKFHTIQGIEPNSQGRQLAQKKSIPVVAHRDDLNENLFSCITLWHVLEHIPDLTNTIRWLHSHLHNDGTLLIAVPNHASHDANYYQTHWAGWDVPRHLWHFSKPALTSLLEEHHFNVIKFLPLPFDAFYVSLLSEKYLSRTNTLPRALWRGTISNLASIYTKQPSSFIAIVRKSN